MKMKENRDKEPGTKKRNRSWREKYEKWQTCQRQLD